MNSGAFGLLDCLGFKGVWNRGVLPDQVLAFLEHAKAWSSSMPVLGQVRERLQNIEPSLVFISDTVAVSTRLRQQVAPEHSDAAAGYLVGLAGHMAVELCTEFATAPVPLSFRGVITYGAHIARDSFLVGPAVDDAAQLAESAQGAFIWLAPRAASLLRVSQAAHFESFRQIEAMAPEERVRRVNVSLEGLKKYTPTLSTEEMAVIVRWWNRLTPQQQHKVSAIVLTEIDRPSREDFVIRDYPMELKAGGVLEVDIVNPLFKIPPDNHRAWTENTLSSFDEGAIDVLQKKQNTRRFLEHASRVTRKAVETTRSHISIAKVEATRLTGVKF